MNGRIPTARSQTLESPGQRPHPRATPRLVVTEPERPPAPILHEERRVLLIAPQPFYEDRGTPIAVRQVVQALLHLGHPVDLVTYPLGNTEHLAGLRYFRGANPLGFRHVPIGFSARKLVLDTALLPTLAARLRRGCYHHIHAVEEAAFLAVLLAGRGDVPILYDMQSSLAEQMGRLWWGRNPPIRRLFAAAEAWLLRRVDLVVASAGLGRRVTGVDVREWRFSSAVHDVPSVAVAAARQRLRLPEGGRVVLYSGSFAAYQGLSALVDAMPRVIGSHPDATFVLIGAANGDGEAIRSQAHELGVAERIRLVPRQSRDSLAAYLSLADVLVSPRRFGSNLPLKIFDFLAAGRAIVATDIPAHRAVLDEDLALMVAPESSAVGEAIVRLLADEEARLRLAERARAYARARLGWLAFVDTMEEITTLMARGRRVPGG